MWASIHLYKPADTFMFHGQVMSRHLKEQKLAPFLFYCMGEKRGEHGGIESSFALKPWTRCWGFWLGYWLGQIAINWPSWKVNEQTCSTCCSTEETTCLNRTGISSHPSESFCCRRNPTYLFAVWEHNMFKHTYIYKDVMQHNSASQPSH